MRSNCLIQPDRAASAAGRCLTGRPAGDGRPSADAEKPCPIRYPRTIATRLLLLLRPSCTPVPGKNIETSISHTSGKLVTNQLRAVVELDWVYAANYAQFATGNG
jgi:hypothetical protein